MNELRYLQLSNLNLMLGENDQEYIPQYFYYLGQGLHHISFLTSSSSNIVGKS